MPRGGTISACGCIECNAPSNAIPHATIRAVTRFGVLRVMSMLLFSRLFDGYFRLRFEIDDLEAQWIPAARLRILCRVRVRVLDCRDPATEGLGRTHPLAGGLQITHLREIRQPVCAREEAHRRDLHPHRAPVLMD